MSGAVVSTKAFFVGQGASRGPLFWRHGFLMAVAECMLPCADLARQNTRSAGTSKVGGRVDVSKEINEINFTASITDASARDYEATPWIRDFIVSAEKRLNCEAPLLTVRSQGR